MPADKRRLRSKELAERRDSDVSRWADERNLAREWNARAQLVGAMIKAPARVIDLGCGAMTLERALDARIEYVPADIVARDARTHVFDINVGDLPDVCADVAVALGLLEYVHDPQRFFDRASIRWSRLVISYHPLDVPNAGQDRLAKGWFNALTEAEVIELAQSGGYTLTSTHALKNDRIYDFLRSR